MATFTNDELAILALRGFEPAEGYDPLGYTRSHYQTFDMYYGDQISQDFIKPIIPLSYLDNLNFIPAGTYNTIVWKSKIESDSASTPPGAIGIKIYNTSHSVEVSPGVYDSRGDIYVYFVDDQDNQLSNEFHINLEGINDASFDLPGNLAYLVLCYREDITPPHFQFGVAYKLARRYTSDPDETPTVLSDRAVHLGTQATGVPNEPFYSWYNDNKNSAWYDEESQVPELPEGGGGGEFFRENSNIGTTPLPTFNLCATNFMKTYKLTTAQLSDFGNYCWDNNFFNSIVKNWQSPFENIIALNLMPLDGELDTTNENIQIGNVDTGVSAKRVTTQCYKKDMGEINVKEFYANFADYAPFSKLAIMLPMIGKRELNPDEYMKGKIHLYYNIDVITGTCVAELIAIKNGYYHLVDAYQGNIATQIPITGTNYLQAYSQIASGLVGMSSGMAGGLVAGVNSILTAKPSYEKSGSFSGSASRLTTKKPYIFFDTPQLKASDTFRSLHGYVSNQYVQLGTCKGYTVVKYMDMKTISLTASEKDELKQILETGVYINDPPPTP